MRIETLKRRSEFQRVRGGARCARSALVIEARARDVSDGPARFGFTITRKLGGAVERNRIRRRLKAAIAGLGDVAVRTGCDYVIVARQGIAGLAFPELAGELNAALAHVNRGLVNPRQHARRDGRRPKSPA